MNWVFGLTPLKLITNTRKRLNAGALAQELSQWSFDSIMCIHTLISTRNYRRAHEVKLLETFKGAKNLKKLISKFHWMWLEKRHTNTSRNNLLWIMEPKMNTLFFKWTRTFFTGKGMSSSSRHPALCVPFGLHQDIYLRTRK